MSNSALSGIRVLDLSWAAVGPLMCAYLGAHGAEVIKVESGTRVEITRRMAPYKDGIPGPDRSVIFATKNVQKLGIGLNLTKPQAFGVLKRLIAISDVLVESFGPRVMGKWGLTFESIKEVRPDIIMLSTSALGVTGPEASRVGYGSALSALAGFPHFTGWPDREPAGTGTAYTDWTAPHFGAAMIMAALDYRRRTGKGQHIDVSQFECGVQFLAPAILDYAVNGNLDGRQGNRCHYAAPHGAFRCRGEERWCAIAVFTDEEWQRFCDVLGNPAWTREPRFATLLGRKDHEDELETLVAVWTSERQAEEVMRSMQAAGVAAAVVNNGKDLHEDPQLRYDHHFRRLEHSQIGWHTYDSHPFKLSKTPTQLTKAAPCIGEHTEYVCTQILGMSDEEFCALYDAGVFE